MPPSNLFSEAEKALKKARPYRGRNLCEYFGDVLTMKDGQLAQEEKGFFKLMATWVYRSLVGRRKGGVPIGELGKFVHPDNFKPNFVRAIMIHLVYILRKRGLRESDVVTRDKSEFEQLIRAFDVAAQKNKKGDRW